MLRFYFTAILFLFEAIFLSAQLSAAKTDNIHYSIKKEHIKIIDNHLGYTSNVELKGEFISDEKHIEYIAYSELEEISHIEPQYYNSKNKLRKLRDYKTQNTSLISSTFYDGYRAYLIDYADAGNRFEITYDRKGKELMQLSTLELNSSIPTDTFLYTIEAPLNYRVLFKFPAQSGFVKYDSAILSDHILYTIRSIPPSKMVIPEGSDKHYEFTDISDCFVRMIALPSDEAKNPWKYFNNWYTDLIRKQNNLSEEAFLQFDEQNIKNLKDYNNTAKVIFDYVKTKVSYIDIENGFGAYQPRDPNDVLKNKQGDCKDMAFLLYELLKHYGYDVHMAVSSTLIHPFELDFPCMASANHVICVMKEKQRIYYLDATEAQCPYGLPSMHVQGKNIFIIDSTGGSLKHVEIVPAADNRITTTLELKKNGSSFEGHFAQIYKGLSAREFQSAMAALNEHDLSEYARHKYREVIPSLLFDSVMADQKNEEINIFIRVKSDKCVIKSGTKTFITLKFLPFPHDYPQKQTAGTRMVTYQSNQNNFSCIISLDAKVKMNAFAPVKFEKDGFAFDFAVTQTAPDKISISYNYSCDKVIFSKSDSEIYTEVNKLISKTLNSAISYE